MFVRQIGKAIRSTIALWILTAVIYPFIMIGFGQIALPYQANGSLITRNNTVVGSALIGQPFTSERYFLSRPSAVDHSTKKEVATTGVSGATNLAPSNPDLVKRVSENITKLKQANIQPTADLVYTSASGLDPHISLASAQTQVQRIAQARNVTADRVQSLVSQNIDGRFLGIFGEPGVNVVKLNIGLDNL